MNKTASFDIPIHMDALSLLLGGKTDIRAEIIGQMRQGDACLDEIKDELYDAAVEKELDGDAAMEAFEEESCEAIMQYISFSEENIKFDYEESENCDDRSCVVFRIPCEFNLGKYLEDNKEKFILSEDDSEAEHDKDNGVSEFESF